MVIHGKTNGVFQTWIEVLDSIKDFQKPLFKGFNDFIEALVSRPKTSREWHPHLPSYVSEPTNLNPNISNIINRI